MHRSLALELLVIGAVTGVILIALAMVNGTINDRKAFRTMLSRASRRAMRGRRR